MLGGQRAGRRRSKKLQGQSKSNGKCLPLPNAKHKPCEKLGKSSSGFTSVEVSWKGYVHGGSHG